MRQFASPYAYSPDPVNSVDPDGAFSGPIIPHSPASNISPRDRMVAGGMLQMATLLVPGGGLLAATRSFLFTSTSLSFKLGLAYSTAEFSAQSFDAAMQIS